MDFVGSERRTSLNPCQRGMSMGLRRPHTTRATGYCRCGCAPGAVVCWSACSFAASTLAWCLLSCSMMPSVGVAPCTTEITTCECGATASDRTNATIASSSSETSPSTSNAPSPSAPAPGARETSSFPSAALPTPFMDSAFVAVSFVSPFPASPFPSPIVPSAACVWPGVRTMIKCTMILRDLRARRSAKRPADRSSFPPKNGTTTRTWAWLSMERNPPRPYCVCMFAVPTGAISRLFTPTEDDISALGVSTSPSRSNMACSWWLMEFARGTSGLGLTAKSATWVSHTSRRSIMASWRDGPLPKKSRWWWLGMCGWYSSGSCQGRMTTPARCTWATFVMSPTISSLVVTVAYTEGTIPYWAMLLRKASRSPSWGPVWLITVALSTLLLRSERWSRRMAHTDRGGISPKSSASSCWVASARGR
eukprot:comp44856_c0_seq1/m.47520 comp44856_c0_seq1/g.47520  ORF comp44856_c0_seq1/g.47520 comp44856_c0_seq1/m.47520 type:complete len:422 (+) comp44856_c0_seq1:347-1612(+)